MTRVIQIATAFLIFSLVSCQKGIEGNNVDAIAPLEYMPLVKPENFHRFTYDTSKNRMTRQGFELGRKLFYDEKLSRDNTVSCGSCHIQTSTFTQHGHPVSHGINDRLGTRNSQSIMNLAWSSSFFWDGGVFDLDLQPLSPITNPVEMDTDMNTILDKINADQSYRSPFKTVFGTPVADAQSVLKALSQFMLQCVSANSRYDKYVRNEGETLTTIEMEGMVLFKSNCASCHSTDLFTDNQFHNNGLKPSAVNDKGRGSITLNEQDNYLFRTPSLRNLAYSSPYMHDGRFRTLEQVLDHYTQGVEEGPTLDSLLRHDSGVGIRLNKNEQTKIIAFLNTLNDENFIRDEKFSEQ